MDRTVRRYPRRNCNISVMATHRHWLCGSLPATAQAARILDIGQGGLSFSSESVFQEGHRLDLIPSKPNLRHGIRIKGVTTHGQHRTYHCQFDHLHEIRTALKELL